VSSRRCHSSRSRIIMDTIAPLLVAIAAAVPVLVVSVYIHRCREPDRARLKMLWGLSWFFMALTGVYLVAEVRDFLEGHYPHSALWAVLELVSFGLVLGSIRYSMRACRRRLSGQ